jgi:flavin-dependent dehydrogenase
MVDVIVVGAGATGLLYAERLSREFEVAVVEKRNDLSTDKSWWVPKQWLHKEKLDKYITNEIRNIGVSCNDREVVRKLPVGDICACIDEDKFFKEYVQSIKSNGGKFFVGSAVTSFDVSKDYVEVITETGTVIKGRLVLDCSGVDSIFVEREKNFKHDFYWNVFGKLYSGVKDIGNTSFLIRCYRSLGGHHKGGKVFINDVPEGGSKYTPWLHFVSRRRFSVDEMRNMYKGIVNLPYLRDKLEGAKEVKEKFGWIPARDLKSRSRDRILSLGEAGGLAPFQNAVSFSKRC